MTKNINEVLNTIYLDKGKVINDLITKKIITINEITREVIKINDPELIYMLAKHIKGAPILLLRKKILETNSGRYIYKFARYIEDTPVNEFAEKVIATGDPEYIYKFARHVKEAPIKALADAVIATKNADYIYLFAKDIKDAPIKELTAGIIATGNVSLIYYFLRDINNVSIKNLIDAIVNLHGIVYIVYIALECPRNLEYIVNKVIEKKNIVMIMYLSLYVRDTELKDKLIKTFYQIYKESEIMNLSTDEKLEYLISLYKNGDFETIKEYREEFGLLNAEYTRKIAKKI